MCATGLGSADEVVGPADAVEASVGGFLEGMLPDADDFPALAVEFISYADMW